jgi:hypothetical protein
MKKKLYIEFSSSKNSSKFFQIQVNVCVNGPKNVFVCDEILL